MTAYNPDASQRYSCCDNRTIVTPIASYIISSIADLRSMSTHKVQDKEIAQTLGYYTAGDNGGNLFFWSKTSAEVDNGGTIIKASDSSTGRWLAVNPDAKVAKFGAKGDGATDDIVPIQAAVDSLGSRGGDVDFDGKPYWITSSINLSLPNVKLRGVGQTSTGGTRLIGASSIDLIHITGIGCAVSGFALDYDITPSSGSAIYCNASSCTFDSFIINRCYYGVNINGCSGIMIKSFQVFNYVISGIICSGTVNDVYVDTFILNAGSSSNGALGGIRLVDKVEAFTAINGGILLGVYSITSSASVNSAGSRPAYCKFTDIFCDSSSSECGNFNNSVVFAFSNCWFSGARVTASKAGVLLSTTDTFRFTNCEWFNCGDSGVFVSANAKRTTFNGCTFESNSALAGAGVADGITFAANSTDFIVQGCIAHNGLYTGTQRYGIVVLVGASDRYIISDNLVSGNATGGVLDGGTGSNKRVANNY